MTTKGDWEFRAEYLRAAALGLYEKAEEMKTEANRYLALADRADMQAAAAPTQVGAL